MAHRPPVRRRPARVRVADPFAWIGASGLIVMLGGYYIFHVKPPGTLGWIFLSLVLGAPVQRIAEALLKNGDR